jgi:hypothetical protein
VRFIHQPSGLRAVNCRVDKRKVVLDMKEEKEACRQGDSEEDSLEFMLEEQSRNQIRSDYRRSLGNENHRRYIE